MRKQLIGLSLVFVVVIVGSIYACTVEVKSHSVASVSKGPTPTPTVTPEVK